MNLVFSAEQGAFEKLFEELAQKIDAARQGAVKDAAELAVREGRANIASAGLPSRFQGGLQSRFYPNEGTHNPAALIYHKLGFISVFEFGMTIAGKPLLWLPIEANLPAGVKSPKRYGHKLVSVNIAGKPPLLFDPANRLRGPLFVGVNSATIRKRLDLLRIFAAAADKLGEFYDKRIGDQS